MYGTSRATAFFSNSPLNRERKRATWTIIFSNFSGWRKYRIIAVTIAGPRTPHTLFHSSTIELSGSSSHQRVS
jgi:hypothetical protein